MKLEGRCRGEFEVTIRMRGFDYFRSRAVKLASVSEFEAQFEVTGTQLYNVSLDWSAVSQRASIKASCSCAYFIAGSNCKHLWATLLEMDRGGLNMKIPGSETLALSNQFAVFSPPPPEPVIETVYQEESDDEPMFSETSSWKSFFINRTEVPSESQLQKPLNPATRLRKRYAIFILNLEESRRKGRLVLELGFREKLKDGAWGVLKSAQWTVTEIDQYSDPADQELIGLLLSPANQINHYQGLPSGPQRRTPVHAALADLILQRLLQSKKFFLFPVSAEKEELSNVSFDLEKWNFELTIKDEADVYVICGLLRRGDDTVELDHPTCLAVLESGHALLPDKVVCTDWKQHFQLARRLRSIPLRVPKTEENELLEKLMTGTGLPPIHWPESLQWPVHEIEPQAVARLRFFVPGKTERVWLEPVMHYRSFEVRPTSHEEYVFSFNDRTRLKRNWTTEKKLMTALESLLVPEARLMNREKISSDFFKDSYFQVIQELLKKGWQVEIEQDKVIAADQMDWQMNSSGIDWFDLNAEFRFNQSQISLAQLLSSRQKGEKFVRLESGEWGLLSNEWVTKLDYLLEAGTAQKDGVLRFPKSALPLFKPWLDELPSLKIGDDLVKALKHLDQLTAPVAAETPKKFKGELRAYQAEGVGWMQALAAIQFGGVLADDMGLGKTIQVIAFLLSQEKSRQAPALIVVPKSLIFNWQNEMSRFAPSLSVINFTGSARGALKPGAKDIVLTTYHTLRQDIEKFAPVPFHAVFLDEAQNIKNPSSQIAQAVYQLQSQHRWALTGTPIENSLRDLFSILHFTNPGLIPNRVAKTFGDAKAGAVPKENLDRLARAVRPFLLRRTKDDVLKDLPDKSEQILFCDLEDEQKQHYESLRHHYRLSLKKQIASSGLNKSKMHVLEALLRLRQASCHSALIEKKYMDTPSAKVSILIERLKEIASAGHKALVFSQFTSFLNLCKKPLTEAGLIFEYLDGRTRDREERVTRFNTDTSCSVFLISLKAGGVGLNLTSADYVFLLDPWWNPAVETQAIDRAHRIGQTKKVMAFRLVSRGTIEEKILELQAEKRSLIQSVIGEGEQSLLKGLTPADLEILLS